MRVVTDEMYYGDYKFFIELDTGAETGANQLTVWVAEKVDINDVALSQFSAAQLLKALPEPLQSRLRTQLEEEKRRCRVPFEEEIAQLQRPFQTTKEQKGKRLPGKVKRKVRNLRTQMKTAVQRLEADFQRRELQTLERDCFDLAILQAESRVFGEEQSLRDFYFEEVNDLHIHNFCRKFAMDATYRQEVLAGETSWAKRNALFVRNLFATLSDESHLLHEREYDRKAHDLFRWIDAHAKEILALPEYQRLKEIDTAFEPHTGGIDPLIRQAVEVLNRIPGVTTQFACQGVSGKVHFQGRDLLVVSPHVEFAYVSFSALGQAAHDAIIAHLSDFPSVTPSRTFGRLALSSTGDNLRFREELVALAQRVLDSVDESWQDLPEEHGNLNGKFIAQHVPLPQNTSVPGGILPSRLEWLCQPAQIERTLHLLFYLNHWTKAREHLLYADRQGLYQVKAAILQQAYTSGAIAPIVYVDGSQTFASDYSFELAAGIATEVFLERLADLFTGENRVADDEVDKVARCLFMRITGYEARTLADVEALDTQQVETAIHEHLQALVSQARATRQPIAGSDLSALFIEPSELLDVYWSRNRPSPRWDELDEGEARKLDPEGLSLIAFQYDSPTAHYIFHLPFRIAEKILSKQRVDELKNQPGSSREDGSFYGCTITEAESQEHPIEDILRELMVDIPAICPYGLIRKQEHLLQKASRYPYWYCDEDDEDEDEDWEDEDWKMLPRHQKHSNHVHPNEPTRCPLCGYAVDSVGLPRTTHWQQTHPGQDLTISHVAWVLGKSKADLKSLTFTLPPDYRSPSPDGQGTRFWRLETLETAVQQGEALHLEANKGVSIP